jgi:alpha-beta hydrolase superfamily lysophospholipase
MKGKHALQNPHLEGDTFIWEGGPFGILLLHGFTATTAEVRPLAKLLHQNGYTVSGPLLPGFGTTPEQANLCRWQDWAAAASDAYQRLTELCLTVFVGGESMGGLLALYLASQQPEIAGLLLYAPALKSYARFTPLAGLLLSPFIQTVRKKPVSTQLPTLAGRVIRFIHYRRLPSFSNWPARFASACPPFSSRCWLCKGGAIFRSIPPCRTPSLAKLALRSRKSIGWKIPPIVLFSMTS